MIPYKNVIVCLLLLIPLASTELKTRKLPRDITLLTGKIMSFTGAGQHDLRDNIPGEPGVDYPIYSSPPETSFSCFNRHEGYYADVESRCQVFRICSNTDHSGKGFAFLCPNGTLFSQHDFVCDWYKNVGCDSSPNYYFMNELLDKAVSPHPELLMKDIVAMVNYPMKIMKQQKKFQNGFPQITRLEPTTPRPIPVEIPTQPQFFTPAPQPVTPPVRNPFERVTPRPQAQIFINSKPQITQQRIPGPQFQTFQPQNPEYSAFPLPKVPQPQIIEPTQQPFPELFNPVTSTTPQPTPQPTAPSTPEVNEPTATYDPDKVYISNLGELSTDPGSNFDPNTAVILPDKSQEQSPIFTQAGNQEHLLEGKLEPNPNEAHKNLLLNLENIASSVPGNINSQLALVRDQPYVDGSEIQVPGTLHVSLNYTQRINTALKNVLIPSAAQDQLATNPILSSDGKLVSQIFGQNPLQSSNGILKFAHNINSAFQLHNPILNGAVGENKDIFSSQNPGPSQDTGIFSTGRGFSFPSSRTPYGPDGKIISQSYTSGPGQQSIQGVGFTKSSLAVSTPASVLHTETIYIPSVNLKALGQPASLHSRGGSIFKRITNRGRRLQSTTHIIHNQSSKPDDSNGSKSQSAYVNIPGTKISIAKSIEEGFFSVSNYPLLPNNDKPMSFSSIFPGIIIHPGSPFALKDRSKFNSNFFSPTSAPVTTTTTVVPSSTTTTISPPIIQIDNGIFTSTAIPSLTSIPLTPHSAQRRSDAFSTDEDDEDSFFKGVSSYNVPISSVGRLPADILGTRRRRFNRRHH